MGWKAAGKTSKPCIFTSAFGKSVRLLAPSKSPGGVA